MKVRVKQLGAADDFWSRPGATTAGFYNNTRRYENDVFELLDPGHLNPNWMEVVDDSTPVTVREIGAGKRGATVDPFHG